ncbi:unnamed protein product [Linum trigynum]|uniref:Uncharacterized protein n=1 Tax=Linum trigynum TaxID=586398 RepID=A0AAV2EWW2_9ROSI
MREGRERKLERVRQLGSHGFHDVSFPCRSGAAGVEVNGGPSGKCQRWSRFGRKLVSINRQASGNQVWYRLQVDDGNKRWFIVLNEIHVVWLQGVLQTAAMRKWSFPELCVRRFRGRVILIGKFKTRWGEVLQISEQVLNGRVFKVLIPSSGPKEGWAGLIRLLQSFYKRKLQLRLCPTHVPASLPLPPPPLHLTRATRSYAEVVMGGGLYGGGNSSIKGSGKNRFIEVGEDGISEREGLLGRSLIISFSSPGSAVFKSNIVPEVRDWATRYWAIDDSFNFLDLANWNWLLVCHKVTEAIRIKDLNYLSFREFSINISPWSERVTAPVSAAFGSLFLVF